jgi:hypothetical protein
MTEEQKNVIRCAYADLVGALQARNQLDIEVHDWKAHLLTIEELEEAFDFIEPVEIQE